jgi:hypothetical protein
VSTNYETTVKLKNAAFAALSGPEKRVAIALDVIAALDAKKLTAESGTYARMKVEDGLPLGNSAQDALAAGKIRCDVCALGAVFTCAVERLNELTVDEFEGTRGPRKMHEYLGTHGVFDSHQLSLIESAFERDLFLHDEEDDYNSREFEAAIDFGRDFVVFPDEDDDETEFDADGCMRAIMQNIVKNKGEFRP